MGAMSRNVAIAVLLTLGVQMSLCQSTGTATTTRYWDCCKTTCAWSANAGSVTGPVETCAAGGATVVDANTQSGCAGGSAYVCNNQQPFVQDGQAYAFAAANVNGLATSSLCCACYTLTFNAAPVQGQKLTVQVINTGSDLNSNQFDLQIPGGGFGMFTEGCPKEWPAYTSSAWGAQYGGVANRTQCNNLPSALVSGCQFRFDWMRGADNPGATFTRVACPTALTSISKCTRNDE